MNNLTGEQRNYLSSLTPVNPDPPSEGGLSLATPRPPREERPRNYTVTFDNVEDSLNALGMQRPTWTYAGQYDVVQAHEYGPNFYVLRGPQGQEIAVPKFQQRQNLSWEERGENLRENTATMVEGAKNLVQNARMPTRDEVLSIAQALGQAAWGVVQAPTNPDATLGQAWDVAGTAITGTLPAAALGGYPEGALGIFGGRKAQRPGESWSGKPAPESVGADGRWRFEIDDSELVFIPENISTISDPQSIGRNVTTIGDVLIHDELFSQYPELANIRVVFDDSLRGQGVTGYIDSRNSLIAFHPDRALDLDSIKNTLVHELQHAVQDIEGFARGSSPFSTVVGQRARDVARTNDELIQQRRVDFETKITPSFLENNHQKIVDFYFDTLEDLGIPRSNIESAISGGERLSRTTFRDFLPDNSEESRAIVAALRGLDTELVRINRGFSPDPNTGHFPSYIYGPDTRPGFSPPGMNPQKSQFEELLSGIGNAFNVATATNRVDAFSEVTGFTPNMFSTINYRGREYVDTAGVQRFLEDTLSITPEPTSNSLSGLSGVPGIKETPDILRAYSDTMGEVEARNAAARRGLTMEERRATSPESTEDVRRVDQWMIDGDQNPQEISQSRPIRQPQIPRYPLGREVNPEQRTRQSLTDDDLATIREDFNNTIVDRSSMDSNYGFGWEDATSVEDLIGRRVAELTYRDTLARSFYPFEDGMPLVFRSGMESFLQSMEIPSKGIKGSQFIKEVMDNPTIRSTEWNSMGITLDPSKRYTREELSNIILPNTWDVKALPANQFSDYQRQNLLDPEIDYQELVIYAYNPQGRISPRNEHYGKDAIAHTRVSTREGPNGNYVLVEEIQSDLVQGGWNKPRSTSSLDENTLNRTLRTYASELSEQDASQIRALVNDPEWLKSARAAYDQNYLGYGVGFDELNFQPRVRLLLEDNLTNLPENFDEFTHALSRNLRAFFRYQDSPIINPPIKSITEATDLSASAIIAYARQQGVDTIVFPPLEDILRVRGDADFIQRGLDPKSSFHQTYVRGVQSTIERLQEEFGDAVQVRPFELRHREMPTYLENSFPDLDYYENFIPQIDAIRAGQIPESLREPMSQYLNENLGLGWESATTANELRLLAARNAGAPVSPASSQGIEVNIRGLTENFDVTQPKFNKGGLVEQTQEAFGEML